MMNRKENYFTKWSICLLVMFLSVSVYGQKKFSSEIPGKEVKELIYKIVDADTLKMELYFPDNVKKNKKYPTIVFYYGGGWNGGTVDQFRDQAGYFASRGMVTVLVDYRVKSRHDTTPYEAVKDAKSAIRYLKEHAKELHIDNTKMVASGGSAGGHLAAAVALLPSVNESIDNLSVNTKVSALVLYNAVVDNGPGPGGFQHERMGEAYLTISPIHNIEKGAPPTLFILGDKDHLIPVSVANDYKARMDAVGSRCEVLIYEGQGHGFFNKRVDTDKYYRITTREVDKFLSSLGYIKGQPTL